MNNFFFDNLNNKIKNNKLQIGIIGIGYVGIQLFINFCKKKINTIGFDRDLGKISKLKRGISPFSYIENKKIKPLKNYGSYSSDFEDVKKCDVIIICLPTPVKKNTQPDLSVIENTIKKIKKFLKKGQLIILESTTYPGTTREKIAKELKNFKIGKDIFLSYSPERENPGSKMPFENVTKISSGYSSYCSALSGSVYRKIVKKVILANTLEEAEMTKLLENIYRSVNIGLVNELKIISKAMNININNVIKLASTKPFGFETFFPGPGIGGHCIPIDPYYLYWRAKKFGQTAKFIKLAGDINLETTSWTIRNIVKILKKNKKKSRKSILILGAAYKKNIEDIRESAGVKILIQLRKKKHKVHFADPYVNYKDAEVKKIMGKTQQIRLNKKNTKKYDCVILVTDHDKFNYKMITKYSKILIDTRNRIYRKNNFFRL